MFFHRQSRDSRHESSAYEHLVDSTRPWYKKRRLVLLNIWIAVLLITSSTNGFDGSMVNGLQSLDSWESAFNYPSGSKLGFLGASQNVGALLSLPIAPFLTDTYGRRCSIFLGVCFMIFGVVLQTASQSVGMFIGARFLIGFGTTFAANAAPLLVTEIAYPSHRGPLTSLYNTMWFLGSITASWSTYGSFHIKSSWSWRLPSALQGLPSVIQLALIWFVPESPRWLVSKGQRAKALQTLAYYHSDGNEEEPLVQYEYEEIKAAIAVERATNSHLGWASFTKTKGNRKRLRIIIALAVFSQWSGNGLLSYYLSKVLNAVGITESNTQLLINGCLNIFNFTCAIFGALICDKVGRRRLFLISTSSMLLFWSLLTMCIALYVQAVSKAAAYGVVVFIFLFTTGYAIAFTPLIVSYTLEILPFALRAKGFAIFSLFVSASVIFNQYINPIALERLGWKYYLVYVGWLAFELVYVVLFVVETKDRTLEETAAMFDGDDTVMDLAYRASLHAGIDFAKEAQLSSPAKEQTFQFGRELSTWSDKTGRKTFSRQSKGASSIGSDSDILAELPKVRFAV